MFDVTERRQADEKLEQLHKQLVTASRQAGMAEVATGVLHNVGNVLNSVNVSASLLHDKAEHSKVVNVGKIATMIQQQAGDLAGFPHE
jgi:signal transduction histidine kinase